MEDEVERIRLAVKDEPLLVLIGPSLTTMVVAVSEDALRWMVGRMDECLMAGEFTSGARVARMWVREEGGPWEAITCPVGSLGPVLVSIIDCLDLRLVGTPDVDLSSLPLDTIN